MRHHLSRMARRGLDEWEDVTHSATAAANSRSQPWLRIAHTRARAATNHKTERTSALEEFAHACSTGPTAAGRLEVTGVLCTRPANSRNLWS